MSEFELIARHFAPLTPPPAAGSAPVALGVGDDCALLRPAPGQQLAVSTDMLIEGRHFLPGADPRALGHKALAVNLSDLAAMGAQPLGFTLALALPPERAQDSAWLQALASGLGALASAHACPLVGGDTTAGPLNLCITVFGQTPEGQALRRSGAQAGDDVWISGTLGDARLALGALRGEWALPPAVQAVAAARLHTPSPRVALGQALRGLATSAIDISDGLAGDLGHVLRASGVGACLSASALSRCLRVAWRPRADALRRQDLALHGGDDYELAFTAAPGARTAVRQTALRAGTHVRRIGRIEAEPGLRLQDAHGHIRPLPARGFDHFAPQG